MGERFNDFLIDERTRVSAVMMLRLWMWMVRSNLSDISLRRAEEATEEHHVPDVHGALRELHRLGLLSVGAETTTSSHAIYKINNAAKNATARIRASLFLQELARTADSGRVVVGGDDEDSL